MKDKKTSRLTNDQLRALATISPEAWEAIATLAREMADLGASREEKATNAMKPKENDVFLKVTNILQDIGVPARIKGYAYLREAVILVYNDWSYVGKMCTALYPAVAKKYETKPNRVESAIRHAIQHVYENTGKDILSKYVNSNRTIPSNSEVIASLAEYLSIYA